MKTCPQCQSEFADDYVFCMSDGTPLASAEAEPETVVSSRVQLPATTALAPEMLSVCANCGLQNRKQSKFCKKCGAALASQIIAPASSPAISPLAQIPLVNPAVPENSAPIFQNQVSPIFARSPAVKQVDHAPAETVVFQSPKLFTPSGTISQSSALTPPVQSSNPLRNWIIGVAATILLIGGGIGIWFWTQPNPLEQKLDAAIKNKQIILPAGSNAYDFYHQLKVEGASAAVLKKYEDRVFPFLTDKIDDVLKTVAEPGYTEKRLEEWQEEIKKLEWASELRPDDKKIAAKLAYCKGRVAYIADNKNAALEEWKRAADLDTKWALPLNGVGLIYNEKKDYETARNWLDKAIEREPMWAIPYNNYGTSLFYQSRFDEAEAYYRKAVEYSPLWARPHAWLASVAEKRYDYQTAIAEYERVFASDAIGTEGMEMETIRRKYEKAKTNSYSYYGY